MYRWKKAYETGIPEIDIQHKKLFELLGEVLSMISEENTDASAEVEEVLDELEAYSVYHFRTEEQLMAEWEYQGLEAHRSQHQEFIATLQSLMLKRKIQKQPEQTLDLLDFMLTWLTQHTLRSDLLYVAAQKKDGK